MQVLTTRLCLAWCWSVLLATASPTRDDVWDIGCGIADITGPAAGVNMMGYANPAQMTSGIHTRLWSRSFIFGRGANRFVYVLIDAAMGSQMVKREVVKRLQSKYGTLYSEANVCLSATHTHSGPGGFMDHVLYLVTSLGFVEQSFTGLVEGIVKSVERAHTNVRPGYIFMAQGNLKEASVNRSPTAYLKNPPAERAKYDRNVDTQMILLKLVDLDEKPIGMINWFPVHCTSMNETNRLISSDNKGFASLQFEAKLNPGRLPGKGRFVAGFAQSNEGDVSPNIRGARCLDTGELCELTSSTCNGRSQMCVASGPGKDMYESTRIIGHLQFRKAWELFRSASTKLRGPLEFQQQYVDMSDIEVEVDNKKVKTCLPAMGHSFAAGTTDGPGMFDFRQGTKTGEASAFWSIVSSFLRRPSPEQETCHHPKPILFPTGEMKYPYPWQPSIVDTQILRIGDAVIVATPGEFTTMAGRRLRDAVKEVVKSSKSDRIENPIIIISGLSNTYTGYTVTPEEYQLQRYEAASTVFGPYTLDAYIKQFKTLARTMMEDETLTPGPSPPELMDSQISLLPGVVMDTTPSGTEFGSILTDVKPVYFPGSTVSAVFSCGHPRNSLQLESSFLIVEKLLPDNSKWVIIASDANWETRFLWSRTSTILGQSQCTVEWDIPLATVSGTYRLRHFGYSKSLMGGISGYQGASSKFLISKDTSIKSNATRRKTSSFWL